MTEPTDAIEALAQFNLAETDDGYLLEIGGSAGSLLTVAASAEQIEAIIGALEALISADDEGDDEGDDHSPE